MVFLEENYYEGYIFSKNEYTTPLGAGHLMWSVYSSVLAMLKS